MTTHKSPLAVIEEWAESMGYGDMGIEPESLVAALRANGYVIASARHNRSAAGCAYSGNGSTPVVLGNVCPLCETQRPTDD